MAMTGWEELPEERQQRLLHEHRQRRRREPLDLLFCAPWSVTLLQVSYLQRRSAAQRSGDSTLAATSADRAQRLLEAHTAAVAAGRAYIEREAGYGQVGPRWLDAVEPFTAREITHLFGENDHGDPNLHTHLVVDMTVTVNDPHRPGQRTEAVLDHQALRRVAPAAAAVYELELMQSLTRTLGVAVVRGPDRTRQIDGVPEHLRADLHRTTCTVSHQQINVTA